ncbi:unnamed protein product [Lasius platythorax]|uniref:DDE Tnp4 domain-containing protein n=1 Tax=Lasius platythorax TaxID=488582 RepID=A0AAV2NDJ0_9HYME
MSKDSFLELCDLLRGELEPKPQFLVSREAISVQKQIAVALYKLASTAEYRVVGNVMGIHKSIDGTHIEIIPPKEGYRDFINRKGWPSYNMLAVVDHNGRFRNVVIKHPGSCHDAAVFKESTLYKNADTIIPQNTYNTNEMEVPFMIVGDPAYPLLSWLLKGFSGSLSAEEESFNVYLNSAPVSVEMAFGRLKARWRILHKINCDYSFAPEVIAACCTLHNFVENKKDQFIMQWLEEVEQLEVLIPQPTANTCAEKDSVQGTILRNHIKQYLSENFPLRKALIRP